MKPQFARNPADALQAYADMLATIPADRRAEIQLFLHELPIYFVGHHMSQMLATISATFPLDRVTAMELDTGFMFFERPAVFVEHEGQIVAASGLFWGSGTGELQVVPLLWQPPHFVEVEGECPRARQWVAALLVLIRQKLLAVRPTRVQKHVAARVQKASGHPVCQVVVLREHARGTPLTNRRIAWSCRWLVRGHWRRLPSRMTWIMAHLKGPQGQPLKAPTSRIFSVVR